MKCIIIFSLSSMMLFFYNRGRNVWEMLFYNTNTHLEGAGWLEQRSDAEAVFEAHRRQWTGKHISILRVCFHNILLELCFCCVFISVGFSVWWGSKWRILNSKLSLKLKRTQRERVVDCKLVLCLLLAQSLRPIRRLEDGINLLYSCMACVCGW